MERSDDIFKKFIKEDGLETSSRGTEVDLKHIGKFNLYGKDPNDKISLFNKANIVDQIELNAGKGFRNGLMSFLRKVFTSQTEIKNPQYKKDILELMSDHQDNIKGSVTIAQSAARGADHIEK